MRFWLREDERRPDPAPARADARKALAAGTLGWLLVLVACLAFGDALAQAGLGWLTATAWIGLGLGVAGLAVVQVRRSTGARSQSSSEDASA
ncbi:DUF2530 domain-containing protein [Agromyces sp. MMS24-JH15]|uniref:DUF2530 domain-containing protein n=1 Tax=Agromyces sp. MMS24-JH15 TaxID=3243765 RepID=UPI003748F01F